MPRVLVVEDYPAIGSALRDALAETGKFNVTVAPTARKALSLLRWEQPELAMVDVQLPGHFGGIAFASHMVEKHIPVLLMTGDPVMDWRLRRLGLPHLEKPFRKNELVERVNRALSPDALVDMRERLRRLRNELAAERYRLKMLRERSSHLVAEARELGEETRDQSRRSLELLRNTQRLADRLTPSGKRER
jgi:DNA-binding NtrC family response regulator